MSARPVTTAARKSHERWVVWTWLRRGSGLHGLPQPGMRVNDKDDGQGVRELVDAIGSHATQALAAPRVARLNPEAGNHAITTDPRELGAALRAGERTRERFPYYQRRYGERGRHFTHSDSAWIVTLAGLDPAVAERQLRWLGGLLAARGMPRWLLEVHLEVLHGELVAAAPEKRAAYDTLLRVAGILRDERLSHLGEGISSDLARTFDSRVGSAAAHGLPEAGALVVAAVADERAGQHGAVSSLVQWLADPQRFSADWVAAVAETLAAAREVARG
jgi:hypothetical protein